LKKGRKFTTIFAATRFLDFNVGKELEHMIARRHPLSDFAESLWFSQIFEMMVNHL
jgi:hypothetical protein